MPHVFFSAGDPSGDLHAANVIRRLPGFRISGIGGHAMIQAGMRPLCHIRELAVMGFWEVVRQYPRLRSVLRRTCRFIKQNKVDLLVCVDYPGFNLRLAAFARSRKIPVLYYIAPKVWAWGQWRIRKMRKVIGRLAVIFPFEEAYFNDRGVPARFVGNPLLELDYPPVSEKEFRKALGFAPNARVLGVMPGSRPGEVQRLLPELARAAGTLLDQGRFDGCAVSKAKNVPAPLMADLLGGDGRIKIYADNPAPVLKYSDFLFVKSGTATLEAALNLKPFITVYRTSPVTFSWPNGS
jgi:lipid-A-disaccharide synthase